MHDFLLCTSFPSSSLRFLRGLHALLLATVNADRGPKNESTICLCCTVLPALFLCSSYGSTLLFDASSYAQLLVLVCDSVSQRGPSQHLLQRLSDVKWIIAVKYHRCSSLQEL